MGRLISGGWKGASGRGGRETHGTAHPSGDVVVLTLRPPDPLVVLCTKQNHLLPINDTMLNTVDL